MSQQPQWLSNTDDQDHASPTTPLLKSNRNHIEDVNGSSTDRERQSSKDEWDSEQNKDNPRNWARWFKWVTVVLVSFIEFLTTMPSFMYAPNVKDAQKDLGTSDDTLANFSLTIYVLGFALGPLLFAPLSEMYGRALIYRSCLTVFLGLTVGCALSQNITVLVVVRFLAGCLGAAPVAIGGAVVSDLFEVGERGTAMSIYQAGLIISTVVGPPVGGIIGSYMNWRWAFWITCIMSAFALFCTFVILRETHAPTLKRKIYDSEGSKTNRGKPEEDQNLFAALKRALSRPLKLLVKSPVVLLSCVLIFLVIGFLNLFLTEMSRIFQTLYHMTSGQSGLVYLGLGVGFILASAVFGLTNDRIMQSLTEKNNGERKPEFRLPATIAAMPVIVIGLLWYGWTLQFETTWIIPIVGSGVAGLGITTIQLSLTTYMVDSFDKYSASSLAAITMARSVGGAIVPLVGPQLYQKLGQGWGNSVLALISLVCCVVPILLYKYGARWRGMFSTKDL